MKPRGICGLALLFIVFFGCTKQAAKIPPISATPPQPSIQSTHSKPEHINQLNIELQNQPDVVQKLLVIDKKASEYQKEAKLLAARQVYEEAQDIITEYEDSAEYSPTPEYIRIRDKILKDWGEVLRKEGFEINETSTDILQQEIDILQEILNAEKDGETVPVAAPPLNSTIASIPRVVNSKVIKWIKRFDSGDQRRNFERWIERAGKYLPMIFDVIREEGLPEELAYIAMIESGFNPTVSSNMSAVGMWQFIASTGRRNGLKIEGVIDERRDPVKATRAAIKHLKDLYYYWDEDWFLALSAYNVSERRLRQAITRYNSYDFWSLGWPLPLQTREYIPKFLAAVEIMKNPGQYGFKSPEMQTWSFDVVTISRQASLDVISKAADVKEQKVRDLNPELRMYLTPAAEYALRLPEGTGQRFLSKFASIPDKELISTLMHTVRRRETISEIADMYNSSQSRIMIINNITNPRRLQIGQKLIIPRPANGFRISSIVERTISSVNAPTAPRNTGNYIRINYKVRKNDTLWDIGRAHGISVANLRAWNGLSRNRYIHPNQNLVIWLPKTMNTTVLQQNSAYMPQADTQVKMVYTVRRRDTISRIAAMYGVPLQDVLEWNNLTQRSIIYPGDKIYLYTETDTASSIQEGGTIVHTVRKGDNLWDIARKYGTNVITIMRINNKQTSTIYPGDRIIIPASRTGIRKLSFI